MSHLGSNKVKVQNVSGGVLTVVGVRLQDNEEYTIPKTDRDAWDDNDKVAALFDSGDLIIIQNTETKRWAKSIAQSTTTSTSFQRKVRMNHTVSETGKHRIGYVATISNTNSNDSTECRVQLNDSTDLDVWKAKGNKNVAAVSGFTFQTLTSGTHTIDIDYKTTSGGTAIIEHARIECIPVGVLEEL